MRRRLVKGRFCFFLPPVVGFCWCERLLEKSRGLGGFVCGSEKTGKHLVAGKREEEGIFAVLESPPESFYNGSKIQTKGIKIKLYT